MVPSANGDIAAVNDIYTSLNSLHVSHGSNAGGIVCMQLNRDVDSLFQCGDQLCCLIRKQQTSHILDTDGVRTHILDTLCHDLSSIPVYMHHPVYRTALPVHDPSPCLQRYTAV